MAGRAFMIGQDVLGHQHPELAPIVNTVSLAGQAGGDSTDAMRLLACTTAWLERAVGAHHPALLACRHNLRAATIDEPSHPRSPRSAATRGASRYAMLDDGQVVADPGRPGSRMRRSNQARSL